MIYFKIFKFDNSNTARQAYKNMDISRSTRIPRLDEEVAFISVNGEGVYSITGRWTEDNNPVDDSVSYFTPMSNLIGIIFGPEGDFASVQVDDSIKNLFGHIDNVEIKNPVLKNLADSTGKDETLLVTLGNRLFIDMIGEELKGYKVETSEIILDDEVHAAIK